MSSSAPRAPGGDSGDAVRSLPSKPSLEFERKRAKALLRRLRRTDPEAKLADAQFAVARELGFVSWPRLVQYFGDERETHTMRSGSTPPYDLEYYDWRVRTLLAEHQEGREWAGRVLAAFVPRLYGRSIANVLALPVTIDDARLAVARQHRCSGWDQVVHDVEVLRARAGDPWVRDNMPFRRAVRAISAGDLGALEEIIGVHPELLHPSDDDTRRWHTLMFNALIVERQERTRTLEARRVTEWLASRGMDLVHPLNCMLLGFHGITVAEVEYLLDRGADPNWMPPNGVSVLEHALLRYWNGAAVDVIARRVSHRRAIWIAAGLGDVEGVRRYFDRNGKLVPAAYAVRAPLDVMASIGSLPSLPDPDQLDILVDAALIAVTNGRTQVLELLIDRGMPIDYLGWGGTSLLRFAIGQRDVTTVEMLVRRGADLDKQGAWPRSSAREFARSQVGRGSHSPELRKILELCEAGTPEEVLAEAERNRPTPPPLDHSVEMVIELASDDAVRRNQSETRSENLLIGLLREVYPALGILTAAGVDIERLRATVADRLHSSRDRVTGSKLPLDAEARAIVGRAVAIADDRQHRSVSPRHVFAALVEGESGFTVDMLVACGGDLSGLRKQLAKF